MIYHGHDSNTLKPSTTSPASRKSEKSTDEDEAGDSESESSSPKEGGLNRGSELGTSDDSSPVQAPFHDATGEDDMKPGVSSSSGSSHSVATGTRSEKPAPSQQQRNAPAASGGSRVKSMSSVDASQAIPQTHASPAATGSVPTAPGAKSGIPPYDTNENPFAPNDGALSRAGVPAAAIAVPVSLVGATILVSVGLCIVHRRSLAAQRARNAHLVDVQRNTSIRSATSKAPSIASRKSSKHALIDDPDIEKAIDALYGRDGRASLRDFALQREDSVRASSRRSFPRPDIRRERTYEWPYDHDRDHDYNLRFSRAPPDRYARHPSSLSRSSYYRPRHSFERYSRSTREYQRRSRNSIMRMFRYGREDNNEGDNDGASSTDTILSGHVSPSIHSPTLSRRDSHVARPRLPPRSHSRQTAPDSRYERNQRWHNSYDADSSPHARSRRSW